MKQYIVLVSLIILGIFIFNLILGSGKNSVVSNVEQVFRNEIERVSD